MRKHLAIALVVLVASPLLGLAQPAPLGVVADIPFSFMVSGKSLPAGPYQFAESANGNEITVSSTSGKTSLMAPVVTRLSSRTAEESEVVFDVVGKDYYLSEVYVPGYDGYQLKGAPGQHTHIKIKTKK